MGGGLPGAQEASPEAAVPLLLSVKLSSCPGLSFRQSPAYKQVLQKIKSSCPLEEAVPGGEPRGGGWSYWGCAGSNSTCSEQPRRWGTGVAVQILLISDWEEEVEWVKGMLGVFGQDPLFPATSFHTGAHVCSSPDQRQRYLG